MTRAQEQHARHGRGLSRARFKALHRAARRDWIETRYRYFHGVGPVQGEVINPLKTESAILRGLAARALDWAAYERRAGRVTQARASIAYARRERLQSEASQ